MYDLMSRNNLRNVHVRRRGNTDLRIEYHFLMLYLKTDTNPHTGVTSVLIQKRRITLSGLWLWSVVHKHAGINRRQSSVLKSITGC